MASGQQPVGRRGVVVGEVVIDGTPARAVTGTVRLPRQADRAGMTFNSLRGRSAGRTLRISPRHLANQRSQGRSPADRAARPMTARRRPHHHQSGMPRPSSSDHRRPTGGKMIMERMLFTLRDNAAMLGGRNRVHELINSTAVVGQAGTARDGSRLVRSGSLCTRGWRRHE